MPELPEVEHVARSLETLVRGRVITAVELRRTRLAPDTTPAEFASALAGAAINFVHRRGKHILFDLDNGRTLITHLRMSGRFSLLPAETEDPKFAHAVFQFADEHRLVFDDVRHFGLMKIVKTSVLHEAKELAKLAPEPFSDEFTPEYLRSALARSKRSLKEFLIDQTKVCGLGNIYACEALFAAKLRPEIRADSLSSKKAARLFESIRAVLNEAIEHAAASNVDAQNIDGGYFNGASEHGWFVYDRENEPCVNCSSPIVRLKQGGRSTYYCRRCQHK